MVTQAIPVDFNSPETDGLLPVLLEYAPDVAAGDSVVVVDEDGEHYSARVGFVDRERRLVFIAVDTGAVDRDKAEAGTALYA